MYKTTFKGQDIEEDKIDFESLDYKNIKVLNNFINDQGKIMPRRMTGLTSKQQKKIASLIKKARIVSLLPLVLDAINRNFLIKFNVQPIL